jgi:outer membrane protein
MAAASLAGLGLAATAHAQTAEDKPLVEIGVFGVGGTFPDYPASAQNHFHALPLPYIIYRGQYLQLAPNSIRGVIVNTDRVTFDVSATAAFQSSHDDAARVGMPGLDYMGQIGPRMNVLIAHDAGDDKIDVELPVRAVLSTDFKSLSYRGVVAAPELAYTSEDFLGTGARLKFGFGPEFASARLMDYFYAVAPQFVIPGRPQYNATGGYLGSRAELSYRYPIGDRASVFALAAPELYSGATNDQSPLFKRQYGFSAALGFTYSVYGSTARAQGDMDAAGEPTSSPRLQTAAVRTDDAISPFVPEDHGEASAARPQRKTDTDLEPVAPLPPVREAVHTAPLPPVAAGAPVPLAPSGSAEAPSTIPTNVDYTSPAASPARENEAYPERDMSGWYDRTFAGLDDTDPEKQKFVMISDASGDPRPDANRLCAQVGHIAVVVKTERTQGATPDADKITWHFACRY